MATKPKQALRSDKPRRRENVIVHRGIEIVPIAGKRSETGKALRDALKRQADQTRGKYTRD